MSSSAQTFPGKISADLVEFGTLGSSVLDHKRTINVHGQYCVNNRVAENDLHHRQKINSPHCVSNEREVIEAHTEEHTQLMNKTQNFVDVNQNYQKPGYLVTEANSIVEQLPHNENTVANNTMCQQNLGLVSNNLVSDNTPTQRATNTDSLLFLQPCPLSAFELHQINGLVNDYPKLPTYEEALLLPSLEEYLRCNNKVLLQNKRDSL